MKILNWITDAKSFLIGVLTGVIILLTAYIYFQGEDFRRVKSKTPLSVKEVVGKLPNGKQVERYLIPYRGRFHYLYVVEENSTLNKETFNGRTPNTETSALVLQKKK